VIKVLVVDDEPLARKRLASLIAREPDLQLVGECGDGVDALAKIEALSPELLFLDIKMPGMSGLELGRSLRSERPPYIIFTTAYTQYAVDAFSVDAVDYLLKPFDRERFTQALDKARERLRGPLPIKRDTDLDGLVRQLSTLTAGSSGRTAGRLAIKDGTRFRFLELADITHVQADGDYLHVHTVSGERSMLRERMQELEHRLAGGSFVRVSRSVILNLRYLKEMRPRQRGDYEFILKSGEHFASGTTYRSAVKRLIAELRRET
jgi:two-component system LytT family response regulator